MKNRRFASFVIVLLGGVLAYGLTASPVGSRFPFRFGLDLAGGTRLTYRIDTTQVASTDIDSAVSGLRDVVERRVNLFGVAEPVVQVESTGAEKRLAVELPGVSDIDTAVRLIGETPVLQFRTERPDGRTREILATLTGTSTVGSSEDPFVSTNLTGRYLKRANIEYSEGSIHPIISLQFDSEGADLFADITREHVNELVAIYLDGVAISVPVVREEIRGGRASITGDFSIEEARDLVARLNAGALPLPISLLSSDVVGATLGAEALRANTRAGLWAVGIVALFLIIWYRLPGIIASISLLLYVVMSLWIFRLIPVTLTASGIAGFIMSIGMAVDANILIFERTKEELKKGRSIFQSLEEGFARSWLSIRDSNVSSMITAAVLFWLGTSLVKGFALTFGLGVLISMCTAILITKTLLLSFTPSKETSFARSLYSSGFGTK